MNKKISEIKAEFEAADKAMLNELYAKYEKDERTGVVNLIQKYKKQEQKLCKERERIENMRIYERKYADFSYICGIDEVGRGLSEKRREELYDEIMEKAIATGIGIVSPARIDEINILQATYEAMRIAIQQLETEPDLLLNDAVTIPEVTIRQVPIVKGDAKSVSIAAASIIAKVTRDRLMVWYDDVLSGYGFASNKGYGSAEHITALKTLGATPIHRMSFIKNFVCD